MSDTHAANPSAPSAVDTASLAKQIADLAVLRGRFTLRSGRVSTYYLDKYRFSTRAEVLAPLASLFAERIDAIAAKTGPIDRLAGAELGGIPLVTAACLKTALPTIFVRNAKKSYGTAKQLEGELHEGERVVLLEDVATTGGQAIEAINVLREAGADVVAVICTIDREEGAREAIEAEDVMFEAMFTRTDLGVTEE